MQDARGLLSGFRSGDHRHPVRPDRAQRPEVEIRSVIDAIDGIRGGTGTRGEYQVVVGQLEPRWSASDWPGILRLVDNWLTGVV